MYEYTRKIKWKKQTVLMLSAIALMLSVYGWSLFQKEEEAPVFQMSEALPVISIPVSDQNGRLPFDVDAKQMSEYFDGSNHELSSVVEFEGVYRPNQGIDYAYENQEFSVFPIYDGVVKQVYEDDLLGSCIAIESSDYLITYASLSDIKVKSGDQVKSDQMIAQAGKNNYRRDLGNHLYIAAEKSGIAINPKQLYQKAP